MIKVLILVCSINIPHADCQTNTAISVINGPDASNESTCAFYGQAYFAGTALGASLTPDEYIKVKCQRPTSIGKANVG